jgi:cell division protein FtsI/penicillin-binding protein 2
VVLAISQPMVSVFANLTLCTNRPAEVARVLAPLLDVSEGVLAQHLHSPEGALTNRESGRPQKAVMLLRRIPMERWELISNTLARASFGMGGELTKPALVLRSRLQHEALFAREEQVRIYPFGNALAHLTGYVSDARHPSWPTGESGVEGALDKVLAGTPGVCLSEQDAKGRELPFRRRRLVPQASGDSVVLTIDLNVQQMAVRALAEAVRKHSPKDASVIVMRPRTGEIMAWACWPPLGAGGVGEAGAGDWLNHALSDRCEPGSTFKIFTLAAALNEGTVNIDDPIFCENSRFSPTNHVVIHDHLPYGWLTIRTALAKSSNIAFAKIALRLGADRLHRYLSDFGFGRKTGVPLVAETTGYLPAREACFEIGRLARLAFGQGVAVSQLQMTMAVAAICNEGRLMQPLLVRQIEAPDGKVRRQIEPRVVRSVISPRAARQVREALETVLSAEGTGSQAKLAAYSAAGKTGTAQKSNRRGYLAGQFYSSFVGFFPVEEPEVCISVSLDEPQNGHYGGTVAGPVFRQIAEELGPYLGLPPDRKPLGPAKSNPASELLDDATGDLDVDSESAGSVGELPPSGARNARL